MGDRTNGDRYDSLRVDREAKECPPSIRGFLYWWLESDENDRRYVFDLFISVVIVFSIVLLVMDTSYGPPAQTPDWIPTANLICLVIFVVEYLFRFWVNTDFLADVLEGETWFEGLRSAFVNKLGWMIQPFSLIDLVAIIPVGSLRALRMFRFFRIARLLRILKLGRYSSGFSGFIDEIKNRSFELISLGVAVSVIIFVGAIAIFTVEGPYTGESQFQSFADALWWATVTTTTVGYGDLYPQYTAGRLVAAGLMLSSIGIVGALGGILTSAMMERIRKMREGRVDRLDFEDHIVFCGWTPSARKVAETLNKTGVLDENHLVVINEGNVPDENYLIGLEGDFTRPENLRTVNAGDAKFVVVFYQVDEDVTRELADRRSVLTALQAEKLNPDGPAPHTITEVFDEESSALVTGDDVEGDETLDKEQFDANLILNTIQSPGHTTKMFYKLSGITGQWIQLHDPQEFYSDDELPVSVGDFKQHILDEGYDLTFLGLLGKSGLHRVNPPNDRKISEGSSLYLVEDSPYPHEEHLESRGGQHSHSTFEEEMLYALKQDFVFLGWNDCARRVMNQLEDSRWIDNDCEIVVVSETKPPSNPWIKHIQRDYSRFREIRNLDWWSDKKLGILFYEQSTAGEEGRHQVDIKTATTALNVPKEVRLIAEIVEEDYSEVLQRDIPQDIELVLKERFDANLIANTIINEGKMTDIFEEIVNQEGTRLKTFKFTEFTSEEELSVREVKAEALKRDQTIFLGMMKEGGYEPDLNPGLDRLVERGDILYGLVEA